MSDNGEKTCPLCAEEMDLTDQQLKPCKCGYEICVWCWHHIMDMAEKDETEGRCPACRTPYNKEKTVSMAANCERLVSEMNMERKLKSQKTKIKTSEGRKQLSSVRVIQRNLVYIVGLPLNLADEDVLQRKEYFGQYGKVLKVSISRTAAGAIQHFANNTCSVYITYGKEEEAIRCIQSVHGFVLEDRSLRACFGTTKYCHAWLRNMPCSNPDCLYLHEIGSQDDSFTKDEIVTAYTRSRVQQITGATNNFQRRSGNVLPPPPADEYCNNGSTSSGKPISKSVTNNPKSNVRSSSPNSSPDISVSLPTAASWGMRVSNNQPPAASLAWSNGPSKKNPDSCSGSLAFLTAVASPAQVSILHADVGKKLISNEESYTAQRKGKLEILEPTKLNISTDLQAASPETPATTGLPSTSSTNIRLYCPTPSKEKDRCISMSPNVPDPFYLSGQSCSSGAVKDQTVVTDGNMQSLCSDISSMGICKHQGPQQCHNEQFSEPLTSLVAVNAKASSKDICATREQSSLHLDSQSLMGQVAIREVEGDLLSFEHQKLKDPEVTLRNYLPNSSHSSHISDHSSACSSQLNEACDAVNLNVDPQIVDKEVENIPKISIGYLDNLVSSSAALNSNGVCSYSLPHEGKRKHMGRFEDEVANASHIVSPDMGESSIISDFLSMDFDPWDESSTSQNLAILLGETDKRQGTLRLSSSWKVQNNNQSRFSFAREEESTNQVSDAEQSLSNFGQVQKNGAFSHDSVSNREFYLDGNGNGFSSVTNVEESDNFVGNHVSSNKFSVSRAQVGAPPGFSIPRASPPGFTSHERMEQAFHTVPGNHLLTAAALRNPYQAPPAGNIGSAGDIEFIDPAILAVGKETLPGGLNSPGLDMRSNLPMQVSTFENEARLQLLMQRSFSLHQNQRFSEMGDSFSPFSDAYGIPSRIIGQTMVNNVPPFSQISLPQSRFAVMSNGHWDSRNDVQGGNDLGMAELLRTERRGLNKFYTGYEDSKFRMPSSGSPYNRTFGI